MQKLKEAKTGTKQNKRTSGIYQIINLTNQKSYVGSSQQIYNRIYEHKRNLIVGKHTNTHLQNAWNKVGEENFAYKILETFENPSTEFLEEREDYWIESIGTMNESVGYNKQNATRGTFSEKWKDKQSHHRNKGKQADYYDKRKYFKDVPEETKSQIIQNILKYTSTDHDVFIDRNRSTMKIKITKKDFEKIVYLSLFPYEPITKEKFDSINHDFKTIVELDSSLQIIHTYNQIKEVVDKYPELNRNQLEILLYCPIKYNGDKPTTMKTAQGKIFLTEEKYISLKESNQLENYFKRKVIPMKEGSRRHLQSLKSQEPKTKVLEVTDTITNSITEYISIQDFILQHQDQDFKRKGIEKVLYGELKTYKGKIFKYKKNE